MKTNFKIKKIVFGGICVFVCLTSYAAVFSAKQHTNKSTKSSSKEIFSEKTSLKAYDLFVANTKKGDTNTVIAYATTVYKVNGKGKEAFILEDVSRCRIPLDKNYFYTFSSSKTKAVDDNWKDVIGDFSKGCIVVGCIFSVTDEQGVELFSWSNLGGKYAKGFSVMKDDLRSRFHQNKNNWDDYVVDKGTWIGDDAKEIESIKLNDLPVFKKRR